MRKLKRRKKSTSSNNGIVKVKRRKLSLNIKLAILLGIIALKIPHIISTIDISIK